MDENKDNHVLYRVTPIFEGNNLVANGVQMEAYLWKITEKEFVLMYMFIMFNLVLLLIMQLELAILHIIYNSD